MTLTQFLLARIAEDEAVARAASTDLDPNWWEKSEHARVYAGDWDRVVQGGEIEAGPNLRRDPLAHIARHDPARVLAECEAKRAIIAFHESWPVLVEGPMEFGPVDGTDPHAIAYRATHQIAWATQAEYVKRFGTEPPTTPMLRALAAVYADHPDYDEVWRD